MSATLSESVRMPTSWGNDGSNGVSQVGVSQCVMLRSFGVSSIPSVILSYGDVSLGMPSRDSTGVYASRHLPEPFKEDAKRVSPLVRRATYCLLPRHLLRQINVSRTAASLSSGCPLGEKPSLSPRLGKVSHYSRSYSQLHASIAERIDLPERAKLLYFNASATGLLPSGRKCRFPKPHGGTFTVPSCSRKTLCILHAGDHSFWSFSYHLFWLML
jgi:hypothetical protein